MEATRPLETKVMPRVPSNCPNFAKDLLPAFAEMERLAAEQTAEGLLISGIWEPDLDLAASLVRDKYGDVVWSKPSVRYILEPKLILEPILRVEVRAPSDSLGNVIGDLMSRRGTLLSHAEMPEGFLVSADVPLAELLGYRDCLRAFTQGRGEATASFNRYQPAPSLGPDPDEPMSAALRA